MNFAQLRIERDRVEQLVNTGQYGPSPASKVFLEAVNNANRTLGQFSDGEVDETAVNQALTEVEALVSTAPEGMPRTSLQKFLIAAREAMKNPNAVESGDSGGGIIGIIPETTDMTGGVGVAPAVSKEELAFLQFHRDKATREAQCDQAIKQALEQFSAQYNCDIRPVFIEGDRMVQTNQWFLLPVGFKSVAK